MRSAWMHEDAGTDDPSHSTRPRFSRANAMFCELAPEVMKGPRNLTVPGPLG